MGDITCCTFRETLVKGMWFTYWNIPMFFTIWLWLLHSHGFSMALIEIDGLPNLKMGGSFHGYGRYLGTRTMPSGPPSKMVGKPAMTWNFRKCGEISLQSCKMLSSTRSNQPTKFSKIQPTTISNLVPVSRASHKTLQVWNTGYRPTGQILTRNNGWI